MGPVGAEVEPTAAGEGIWMNVRYLSLLVVGCLVLSWAPAGAQERGRRYRFQCILGPGTGACSSPGEISARVSKLLKHDPWDSNASSMILVAVTRTGEGYQARVEHLDARNESASSTWKGATCRELFRTVTWSIKWLIEKPVPLPRDQRPPHPVKPIEDLWGTSPRSREPVARCEEVRRPATRHPSRGRPPRTFQVSAGVAGLVSVDSAPGVAGGFSLQARVRWGPFSLGLEGRADLPAYDDTEAGRVRTYLLVGAAVPCFHHGWLSACGNVTAGALTAKGYRGLASREEVLPFAAAGTRLGLSVPVRLGLSVDLYVDTLFALYRPRLNATRLEPKPGEPKEELLWRQPPASGAMGLAITWSFL